MSRGMAIGSARRGAEMGTQAGCPRGAVGVRRGHVGGVADADLRLDEGAGDGRKQPAIPRRRCETTHLAEVRVHAAALTHQVHALKLRLTHARGFQLNQLAKSGEHDRRREAKPALAAPRRGPGQILADAPGSGVAIDFERLTHREPMYRAKDENGSSETRPWPATYYPSAHVRGAKRIRRTDDHHPSDDQIANARLADLRDKTLKNNDPSLWT